MIPVRSSDNKLLFYYDPLTDTIQIKQRGTIHTIGLARYKDSSQTPLIDLENSLKRFIQQTVNDYINKQIVLPLNT